VSTYVGTNDGWSGGTYTAADDNLVETSSNIYDDGGIGDGNLTETITYPGGGAPNRGTLMYYDWRDRLVATKNGALLNTDESDNLSGEVASNATSGRSINFTIYDNLDEPVEEDGYVGDGIGITSADGQVLPPPGTSLRSQTIYSYDDEGRVYRTQTLDVNQTTGADATITGLTNGTPYYFAVSALDGSTESSLSAESSATPSSTGTSVDLLTPIVSDPSFETPAIPSDSFEYWYTSDLNSESTWTFAGESGIENNSSDWTSISPIEGTQAVFLQSNDSGSYPSGSVSQNITLNSTGSYTLTFYAAPRSGYGENTEPIDVSIDGTVIDTVTPTVGAGSFAQYSITFSASAGSHKLKFQADDPAHDSTEDSASFIDDVQLQLSTGSGIPALTEATTGSGQVGLSWDGVPGSTAYKVYWGTSPTGLTNSEVVTGACGKHGVRHIPRTDNAATVKPGTQLSSNFMVRFQSEDHAIPVVPHRRFRR
jgi:hypothetical protein